ncbi:MAG: DNA polymerase III subunit delta [Lachnospiraceae bacterium]|nr:DNA polymerase III subunit delta [Lachnospiraceae bacterium]
MYTIRDDLKSGNLKRFYVLTGTEDYLRRLYLSKLSQAILPDETSMNRMLYDGNKTDPLEVIDAAMTPPFLDEHRLITLVDTGFLKSSTPIADRIAEFPETTYILFMEKECDSRNKLYKYIEKEGHVASFEPLRDSDSVSFIANRLQRFGLRISEGDAKFLLEQTGNDLTALSNEIDKLTAYCDGRDVVTGSDIRELTSVLSQGQMFRMIDAIVSGNRKQAMSLYRDLLLDQTPAVVILRNLINNFYQFSMVLRLTRKGLSSFETAQQLKIPSGAVSRFLKAGTNVSIERVTGAVEYGRELESKVKNGDLNDRVAVELFLAKQFETA